MSASLSPVPKLQFFTAAGVPLVGGKLYSYAAGTTTPQATYTDSTGNTANPNPTILNSRGEAGVWLASSLYKLKLTDSNDVEIWTVDYVNELPASITGSTGASNVGFTPYSTIAATNVQDAIEEVLDELASSIASLAASNGSSLVGFIQSGTGAVARTVQAKLREPYLSVVDFGAVGDDSTSCDTAVANAFAAALAQGKPLYFPEGTYKFTSTSTTNWDLTGYEQKGMTIFGSNSGRTILRFPNVTDPIGLHIKATTDWYDFSMSDLQIRGSMAGALVVIGRNDYADPLNVANFANIIILNTLNNATAEALRLNYVVNSNFIGCRANCFANGSGTNVGTALRARQVEFTTFTNGSYGNAEYGVRFTDGFSFGNVFLGTDHENVSYCVSTDSSNSGNNTFVGGQFSLWTAACFKTTGSLSTNAITVINANYSNGASVAPVIDPTNFSLIRKIDGTPISTPAVPASGATASNITGKKVLVTFWGSTISQVTVNGFGIGVATGSVVVEHGQTVSLTYTGSPTWLWQPME
jgi:hypothetical protein